MANFNVGDIICKDESSVPYTITEIDEVSMPMPKYNLTQGDFRFWDYCLGWKKLVTPEDALRYGKILTDDEFVEHGIIYRPIRIRTISYDNRIFYHKMVNGEVMEFKELTV